MMSEVQKQILVGVLVGVLICVATYFVLGGKRDDLSALETSIRTLQQEVEKGQQMKSNYERLKKEVDLQNKQLEELIRIMPTELDRGELPIRLKKLADTAGIDQVKFKAGAVLKAPPKGKETYYIAYPYEFNYRGSYHGFGRFASQISGFDKMVNITEFKMKLSKDVLFPVTIDCTISAFVYNPNASPSAAPAKPGAPSAPAAKKEGGE